jgi:hypothetical protein
MELCEPCKTKPKTKGVKNLRSKPGGLKTSDELLLWNVGKNE